MHVVVFEWGRDRNSVRLKDRGQKGGIYSFDANLILAVFLLPGISHPRK